MFTYDATLDLHRERGDHRQKAPRANPFDCLMLNIIRKIISFLRQRKDDIMSVNAYRSVQQGIFNLGALTKSSFRPVTKLTYKCVRTTADIQVVVGLAILISGSTSVSTISCALEDGSITRLVFMLNIPIGTHISSQLPYHSSSAKIIATLFHVRFIDSPHQCYDSDWPLLMGGCGDFSLALERRRLRSCLDRRPTSSKCEMLL